MPFFKEDRRQNIQYRDHEKTIWIFDGRIRRRGDAHFVRERENLIRTGGRRPRGRDGVSHLRRFADGRGAQRTRSAVRRWRERRPVPPTSISIRIRWRLSTQRANRRFRPSPTATVPRNPSNCLRAPTRSAFIRVRRPMPHGRVPRERRLMAPNRRLSSTKVR